MTPAGWFQILVILTLVTGCAWLLGSFMAAVFSGKRTRISPALAPVERAINRLAGTSPKE